MSNVYLLKSEFCKKYNVKTHDFNTVLLKNLYLRINTYGYLSKDFKKGSITKLKLGVTEKGSQFIIKKSGSWMQGIFKYNENYFKKLFNV